MRPPGVQLFDPGTPGHRPSCLNILGHVDIRVTHVVPHSLRRCALTQHRAGNAWCGSSEDSPLLVESAGSESPRKVVASIRGQIGMRVCTCEICHRRAYAFVTTIT